MNKIFSKIESFLKERRESDYGGWAKITRQDIEALRDIIYDLIEAKCEADADSDYPIEFSVINRRIYARLHYRPIPYDHGRDEEDQERELTDKEKETRFEILLYNLHLATAAVEVELNLRRLNVEEKDAEINHLTRKYAAYVEMQVKTLAERDAEIERLRKEVEELKPQAASNKLKELG